MADTDFSGRVVVLNGPASAGKTEIAKHLAARVPGRVALISVDAPWTLLPHRASHLASRALESAKAARTSPETLFIWPNVVAGILTARERADDGALAVLDMVVTRREPAEFVARHLTARDMLIGVRCSLEELELRERSRPTRRGLARRQLPTVHQHFKYGLEIDTTTSTAADCAAEITEVLARLRQ